MVIIKKIQLNTLLVVATSVLVSACVDSGVDDLQIFMDDIKNDGKRGKVEPIPTFTPYEPFDYSATLLRAPFDRPVTIVDPLVLKPSSSVKPIENRPKEYLEQFNVESLVMVGTIKREEQLFALLQTPDESVHYLKVGNYLGRNNGKILRITETNVQLVEIVPAGEGWVERPRTVELREVGGN